MDDLNTWRIEVRRNTDDTITVTSPEGPPEWVDSLRDDLLYRLRDSPDATAITCEAVGDASLTSTEEEAPDGAAAATGPITSTGPGTPPPDADTPGPPLSAGVGD